MDGTPAAEAPFTFSFTMSRQDLLDLRAEIWDQNQPRQPKVPLVLQALIAVVMVSIITAIVWFLAKSSSLREEPILSRVVALTGIAIVAYLVLPLFSRKAAAKQRRRFIESPLSLADAMLVGEQTWIIDERGCTVSSSFQQVTFPAGLFSSVETSERFLTVTLQDGSRLSAPLSALGSATESAAVRDRLNALVSAGAQAGPLVTTLLQSHAVKCPGCGYDLHRAAAGVCPECGRSVSLADIERALANRKR